MRHIRGRVWAAVAVAAVGLIVGAFPSAAASAPPQFVPRQLLVKFKQPSEGAGAVIAEGDVAAGTTANRVQIVHLQPGENVAAKIKEYEARPDVAYAEPNYVRGAASLSAPDDPRFGDQWGLSLVNALDAWSIFPGAYGATGGVPIAIVDTGIDASHEDLSGNVLSSSGADCTLPTASCQPWSGPAEDGFGHGTHVAGIAGALTDNGTGVAGLAFNSPLIPVKSLDDNGNGTDVTVANGILWAKDHGAKVINLSLGGYAPSSTLCNAVTQAVNAGVLVVAAAGNGDATGNGVTTRFYPAACVGAIGVGAVGPGGEFPAWSNRGYPDVFVSGPGGGNNLPFLDQNSCPINSTDTDADGIWSTVPFFLCTQAAGSYESLHGTSMATPYVSALAALLFKQQPLRTAAQVKHILAKTAQKVTATVDGTHTYGTWPAGRDPFHMCAECTWDGFYGYGVIDAAAALTGPPPTVLSFTPTTGAAGSTMTVKGEDFDGATLVTFGGGAGAVPTSVTTSSLKVSVPSDAQIGPVSVTTPAGTDASSAVFKPSAKITSFTPPDGALGEAVVITGTNFSGATAVKFGSLAASSFTPVSATEVDAAAPLAATFSSGKISVVTPNGTATSTDSFAVTKVTSFSPASAAAGATVTINGQGLGSVTSVDFGGHPGVPVSGIPTATSVKVVVPTDATMGTLRVNTPRANPVTATVFKPLPKITDFDPKDGQAATTVTIEGSNFTGATGVKFGTIVDSTFSVDDAMQITAHVPGAFSSGRISVTTPNGTATSTASFAVTKVTSISPASAAAGATVTINGQGLGSAASVDFGGHAGVPVSGIPTATSVKVVVPADATMGTLRVNTPRANPVTATVFKPLPKITSFSPLDGDLGEPVTITGTNLAGATAVKFGTVSVVPGSVSATEVDADVPAGFSSGKVSVVTPAGTAVSSASFVVTKVTSFSPASAGPNATVTIFGQGLASTVSIDFVGHAGVLPLLPVPTSGTSVKVVVPPDAGSGALTVNTPRASVTTATALHVTLAVSSVSARVAGRGDTVTITGSGFSGLPAGSVKFNGTSARFTVVDDTTIEATVPDSGDVSGQVTVTKDGSTAAAPQGFTLLSVDGLAPTSGPPGALVVITGHGFTGASQVEFDGTAAAAFTVDSATQITARVPDGASAGPVSVTVGSATAASAASFTVAAQSGLQINEVNANLGADLVELEATRDGSLKGIKLILSPSSGPVTLATLPDLTVSEGQLLVVHLAPPLGVTTESTGQTQCSDPACYDGAWDIRGGSTGLPYQSLVLAVENGNGSVQDAVAFETSGSSPAGYAADLVWAQGKGQVDLAAGWDGLDSTPTGASAQRVGDTDTDQAADWTVAPSTFGLANGP